jgi:predicted NUDIX family NTP pyrophosphohydrolase
VRTSPALSFQAATALVWKDGDIHQAEIENAIDCPIMAQHSAGILMYRRKKGVLECLLVHPGGPFWSKRDNGSWSIPKGLYDNGEDAFAAAQREFTEETGFTANGEFLGLGSFKQPSGKTISVWAVEGDCDLAEFRSNEFSMEWPPRSGRTAQFPEVDRAGWFSAPQASQKLTRGQMPIVQALVARLASAKP